MAMRLSLPASYSWQPQTLPVIAKSTLTQSMNYAYLPFGNRMMQLTPVSFASNMTPVGAATFEFCKFGFGKKYSGSGQYDTKVNTSALDPWTTSIPNAQEVTLLAIVMPHSISSTFTDPFNYANSSTSAELLYMQQSDTANNIEFKVRDSAGGTADVVKTTTNWANDIASLVIMVRSEARSVFKIYINGQQCASATPVTKSANTKYNYVGIGTNVQGGSPGPAWNGSVYLAASWYRGLMSDEVARLSANPWQIFDYPSRPIILDTGAAAAGKAPPPYQRTLRFLPRKVA